jgi:hypothetical protein
MEEEALAWSILIFDQVLLLHPFPLPFSETYQTLADQGLLQARTAERSEEENRQKDRILREINVFMAGNPDLGLLKYLKQTSLMAQDETREEIVDLLKRQPLQKTARDSSTLTGSILLCLIHDWMIQEQAIESSWAKVEEQEKRLFQSWRENPEEESIWPDLSPLDLKRVETEILCPLALSAWKSLRARLFPDPLPLLTTQSWVWADYYGIDPLEGRTTSVPLPDLGFSDLVGFYKAPREWVTRWSENGLRESFRGLLKATMDFGGPETTAGFLKSLAALGLPSDGKYRLILPPVASLSGKPAIFPDKNETDVLILLTHQVH